MMDVNSSSSHRQCRIFLQVLSSCGYYTTASIQEAKKEFSPACICWNHYVQCSHKSHKWVLLCHCFGRLLLLLKTLLAAPARCHPSWGWPRCSLYWAQVCALQSFPKRFWQSRACCAHSPSPKGGTGWHGALSPATHHRELCPPPGCSDPSTSEPVFHLGWNTSCDTGHWGEPPQPSCWGHYRHRRTPAEAPRAPSKAAGDRRHKSTGSFYLGQSITSYQNTHLTQHRDWKRQRGVPGGSRRPWTLCLWSCSAHSTLESALSEPLTHTLIYSCGFSRNRNSETRCTESLVHGVKASIHHVSCPSPMNSFCLLLSSVYIHKQYPYDFFHAYLFPQSLTCFPEAIRKLHINIYISRSLFWNSPQLLLNAIWHQPKIKACLAHGTHYRPWKWV